jgi:alpha-L-fucosidase
MQKKRIFSCAIFFIWVLSNALFPAEEAGNNQNRPQRLQWFQDLGLGLFIHWSVDSQIGSVISHSLVGASKDYTKKFIEDLPKTFYPHKFNAEEWARLAKIAGFRYVVFTTKHHSGFCMFASKTNDFNVKQTPYGRDITAELVNAFKKHDIAPGFYFSPDDFYVLNTQGTLISRRRPEALPVNNPELMQTNKAQVRELLSGYGPIDVIFFDGQADGLKELAWELQPDIVVTRGAMKTPEIAPSTGQDLPDLTDIEPWEACFTMGTSWQFKPTHETYMSGTKIIELLIETRAKGGNMLLNIGPTPEGEIPATQTDILRELGLWMMVNGEAIYNVRPWTVTNEDNIWFTKSKDNTVFGFVTGESWAWGKQKTFSLKSVKATKGSQVGILGQNDKVLEYRTETVPQTRWRQDSYGLHITATRAQRLYNDRTWPNPVVLYITNAAP